jgi:hypothetical protein
MPKTSVDADAQAFLTAAAITSPTISSAVNTFILGCKSNNIWNDIGVILPIVGGSASSHRVCMKTATNKVTWLGGVTHNSIGIEFNGVNGYGIVDWNAPNLYSRTAIEWTTDLTINSFWSGIFTGSSVFGMQLSKVSGNLETTWLGLNNLLPSGVSSAFGFKASVIEANVTNGGKHYGSSGLLNQMTPSANPSGQNYYIGALNSSGSPIQFGNRKQSFFVFGNALNASKIAIIRTLIQDFQTAVR